MVLQRELLRTSRRPSSYSARTAAAILTAFALLGNMSGLRGGRTVYFAAVVLAYIACIFEGSRRASGTISDEKQEGTLGLLLLTPLSGAQLVYGKYAAVLASAFQTGLAAVPIMSVGLLLGGVSIGEFLRTLFALAHTLSLTAAIAIIYSARGKDSVRAMTRTWAVLFFGSIICSITNRILFQYAWYINPITPLSAITDGGNRLRPHAFWISILVSQLWVWAALTNCGRQLLKRWQNEEEASFKAVADISYQDAAELGPDLVPARVKDSPRWFTENPMQWFTLRDMHMHSGRWGVLVMAVACVLIGFVSSIAAQIILFFGLLLLGISISVAAPRSMAVLRESGALELLVTTPLGEKGIINGHVAGLRKVFRWPFWLMALLYLKQNFIWHNTSPGSWILPVYLTIGFLLLEWAAPWIGMASALKTTSPRRAILWTLFLLLVIPRCFACVFGDTFYLPVAGFAARAYVKRNFRRLAAKYS